MWRLPNFTFLIYLINQQLSWSYDRIELTDFLNHGCLVHVSSVAADNNIKYAGSLRGSKIIPFEKAARGQITLHHCLGSLVPNIAMGGVIYISGIAISSSMQRGQGHSQSPYIF
ncbi:hypothetical protein [Candidatus Odyssella thessalonicensis]|uniref:hypothetical protein n=1 Tax=Candidatus Odyssella thessalonicensis TaxID=84647 RepID=UPI000225B4BB|nr:hypothetical protein [Candidatus Odyssella thessalonicensis]